MPKLEQRAERLPHRIFLANKWYRMKCANDSWPDENAISTCSPAEGMVPQQVNYIAFTVVEQRLKGASQIFEECSLHSSDCRTSWLLGSFLLSKASNHSPRGEQQHSDLDGALSSLAMVSLIGQLPMAPCGLSTPGSHLKLLGL